MVGHKIIVFDQDGVLLDSYQYVYRYFSEHYQNFSPELFQKQSAGLSADQLGLELVERTDEDQAARWEHYVTKEKIQAKLFPGIKELITKLSNEYKLVMNTSARLSSSVPMLKSNEIYNHFDFLATKDISTDKVKKFQLIADKYDCDTTELLFITDTLGDVLAAEKVSVPTIGVTWGFMGRVGLESYKGNSLFKIVDNINELENTISNFYE